MKAGWFVYAASDLGHRPGRSTVVLVNEAAGGEISIVARVRGIQHFAGRPCSASPQLTALPLANCRRTGAVLLPELEVKVCQKMSAEIAEKKGDYKKWAPCPGASTSSRALKSLRTCRGTSRA